MFLKKSIFVKISHAAANIITSQRDHKFQKNVPGRVRSISRAIGPQHNLKLNKKFIKKLVDKIGLSGV